MTQEEKARAYDKAIEKIKYVIEHGVSPVLNKEDLQDLFLELRESEDERIRNEILCFIKTNNAWNKEWIAWLEKQGESNKSLYIRFGDIPANGKSKIYNGEIEIGIEEGISVYPAFEDKEGNIILGLNLPITKTSLHTQQHLLEYDNRPCYIVTGDYIGKGTDGEPLIKNVRIIKEIKPYRIKEDKENNTYVINNTPNCGISVYNEELKESEDERVRKAIISYIDYEAQRGGEWFGVKVDDIIAWLEKQVDKPVDNLEPKFKVGDWITNGNAICHISNIRDDGFYCFDYGPSSDMIQYIDNTNHLWGIEDAEDGDVLTWDDSKCIALFKNIYDEDSFNSYGFVGHCTGTFESRLSYHDIEGAHPATKEQRDLLFQKMKEAGYEWDGEKKELMKIEKQASKTKWTEEDESKVEDIVYFLITAKTHYASTEAIEDCIEWIKSLKRRMK